VAPLRPRASAWPAFYTHPPARYHHHSQPTWSPFHRYFLSFRGPCSTEEEGSRHMFQGQAGRHKLPAPGVISKAHPFFHSRFAHEQPTSNQKAADGAPARIEAAVVVLMVAVGCRSRNKKKEHLPFRSAHDCKMAATRGDCEDPRHYATANSNKQHIDRRRGE